MGKRLVGLFVFKGEEIFFRTKYFIFFFPKHVQADVTRTKYSKKMTHGLQ